LGPDRPVPKVVRRASVSVGEYRNYFGLLRIIFNFHILVAGVGVISRDRRDPRGAAGSNWSLDIPIQQCKNYIPMPVGSKAD
jgi:hypothetical protein